MNSSTLSKKRIFGLWIIVSVIGWGIALALNGLGGTLAVRVLEAGDSQLLPLRFLLGALLLGAIMGVAIGIPPYFVLARTFRWSSLWLVATIFGAGVGLGLAYFWFKDSSTSLFLTENRILTQVASAFATFSFCVAFFEALVFLRRGILFSLIWLVSGLFSAVVGFSIGIFLTAIVILLEGAIVVERSGWVGSLSLLLLIGTVAGLVWGIVTGGVLVWILARAERNNMPTQLSVSST